MCYIDSRYIIQNPDDLWKPQYVAFVNKNICCRELEYLRLYTYSVG